MLKELIVRFLLVSVPTCGVVWAVAFTAGDLRTPDGLSAQITMTITLLTAMAVLFAGVVAGAWIFGRLAPAPVGAEAQTQPAQAADRSAGRTLAAATSRVPDDASELIVAAELTPPRLLTGAQQ